MRAGDVVMGGCQGWPSPIGPSGSVIVTVSMHACERTPSGKGCVHSWAIPGVRASATRAIHCTHAPCRCALTIRPPRRGGEREAGYDDGWAVDK